MPITKTPLADLVSHELTVALVPHHIAVQSRGARAVVAVTEIPSALRFAAALERAGADASYSAASGWTFRHAPTADQSREPRRSLASSLPLPSSVVPVEAGTGTGSGQGQAAPDGEAPA